MKSYSYLFLIFILLFGCAPTATEPSTLPTDAPPLTTTLATTAAVQATDSDIISDCPLPPSEGTVGKLRLVYVTHGNLWLLDEGKEPVQMLESGDVEQVILSPAGSKIVLTRRRDANNVEMWAVDSIGWRNLSGEQGISGSIEFTSFSDDEQFVAFYRLIELDRELWVADINGSSVRRLASQEDLHAGAEVPSNFPVSPDFVNWIPGTHRLTFTPIHGYPPGSGGDAIPFPDPVFWVDADTEEQSVLFPKGEGGYITYSPDGRTMVIADPSRIRLLDIENLHESRTVLRYPFVDLGLESFVPKPAWTPDSSSFVLAIPSEGIKPDEFFDDPQGPMTIWEVYRDGSATRKLGQFPDVNIYFFFISPDSKRVAYYQAGNVHVANVDGSDTILYDSSQGWALQGWAPDSRHFTYLDAQSLYGYGDICGLTLPLTHQNDAEFAVWLDATRFLMHVGPSGDWDLHLGTAGGNSTRLVEFGSSVVYDYVVIHE